MFIQYFGSCAPNVKEITTWYQIPRRQMQLLQLSQHTCSGGYGWRNSLVREKVYCGSLKGSGLSFGFDCRQAWQFTFTHQI